MLPLNNVLLNCASGLLHVRLPQGVNLTIRMENHK